LYAACGSDAPQCAPDHDRRLGLHGLGLPGEQTGRYAAKITPVAPVADGETMRPLLQQSGALKRDAIYFHYPNYAWHGNNRLGGAVRQGDYKLIENYADRSLELYNLADDISEKNNLATKMPERTAVLAKKLRHWLQETKAQMPTATSS